MADLQSPGVQVREINLTGIIPAASKTIAGYAGRFNWGPIGTPILTQGEGQLATIFGSPSSKFSANNAESNGIATSFLVASSYLAYAESMRISRVANINDTIEAVSATGTVGTITPITGGFSAVLTGLSSTTNLSYGCSLAATAGTGTLFGGAPTAIVVTEVLSATSVKYSVYGGATPTAGNITSVTTVNTAINATSTLTAGDFPSPILIKNQDDYLAKDTLGNLSSNFVIAKYAGAYGNSVAVSTAFTSTQYKSTDISPNSVYTLDKAAKKLSIEGTTVVAGSFVNGVSYTIKVAGDTDYTLVGAANSLVGTVFTATGPGVGTGSVYVSNTILDLRTIYNVGDFVEFTYASSVYRNTVATVDEKFVTLVSTGAALPAFPAAANSGTVTTVNKLWKFWKLFTSAPVAGSFHAVVYDATGKISGTAGTVLESYGSLTNQFDSKYSDGTPSYYKDVINASSAYLWVGGAEIAQELSSVELKSYDEVLVGGRNGSSPTVDDYIAAVSVFSDKDKVDINLLIAPPAMDEIASNVVPNYYIENIAEVRKDCVVYLSPKFSDVVNNGVNQTASVLAYRAGLAGSSYAFMDSGWKYMYDKYNNIFRWVPLCGDVAGTAARTDLDRDAWWSHAGYSRGTIKNIVRLAWNPDNAIRDDLYQAGVNPVITVNGAGTILFGDKTLEDIPSAFDHINVRRLFIVLEKAISNAAKYSLFEFNDEITRGRFISMVTPFLREIQARRGIQDFKVVCDTSNNTAQVIDTNRFVGDIYIKPARSINYITLNFVAVASGVDFTEVVGKY